MDHPNMLPKGLYHLVATNAAGYALYEERNWRMGGRSYRIRTPEGEVRDGTDYGHLGRVKPKAAPEGGRWRWMKEG